MKAIKVTKKLLAMMLALVMALAVMNVIAFAADNGSITINNATIGNTYTVYKVFDAAGNGTSISYKLVEGKISAPSCFDVDDAGNVTYAGSGTDGLTAEDIAAIAEYVKGDTPVASKFADGSSVVFNNLENGYYYITTTTGTAVTITSTNPNAEVTDKNEAPELNKEITDVSYGSLDAEGQKAIAQLGSTVTYTVEIKVKNGAMNYVFHDVMSAGLSYNENSLKVMVGEMEIDSGTSTYSTDPAMGDTITIIFNNDWIADQVDKTIVISYTATVTSDALSVNPANNTATIEYGENNKVTCENSPAVYNATYTVTKVDKENNELLDGASFVLAKTVNSSLLYYKNNGEEVSWEKDIDEATVFTTTEVTNPVIFTGLADGSYTLIETVAPDGYNKAEDTTFTIVANDYSSVNLSQSITIENEAGSLLPTTGGMGTTIIYIVGAVLVIGAGIVLVVRRRMSANQ